MSKPHVFTFVRQILLYWLGLYTRDALRSTDSHAHILPSSRCRSTATGELKQDDRCADYAFFEKVLFDILSASHFDESDVDAGKMMTDLLLNERDNDVDDNTTITHHGLVRSGATACLQ